MENRQTGLQILLLKIRKKKTTVTIPVNPTCNIFGVTIQMLED